MKACYYDTHKMAEMGYDNSEYGLWIQGSKRYKETWLHGHLDIWVKEAKNLPRIDQVFGKIGGGGKKDRKPPVKVTSDPYVTVSVASEFVARTFVISNSENPVWMQQFYVPAAHLSAEIQFLVKDSDVVGSRTIGAVGVQVEKLAHALLVEGTFPILSESGKPCNPGAVLTLSIQYIPLERVARGLNFKGVPNTYFPLRKGGKVTLYQDAPVDDGCLPSMHLDGGLQYQNNGDCWHDICEAIKQARHLIYITGWSVVHSVQLVRSGDGAKDSTLGDLLKAKSAEGVRVLLLWDDPTSKSNLGIKTHGVMGTNDEETRHFFKHSSVKVIFCPRSADKGHRLAKKQETETIYNHHQKTVIVDADAGNYRRRIMAFVGGLDDYHQPNYTGRTTGLPREPWHDLHSRIEGPAAYDVLKNFEERWLRASKPDGIQKMKKTVDDSLLKLERIPDILGIDEAHCTSEQDPEGWHIQVFRSIDSNSVKGFPKDPNEATSKNLLCGKNVLIDKSIHIAYVEAIRAAQHFIYIENQYFLGSSFNWNNNRTLGANNLIPMEIALKIANKIRANERFAAYIVIPMWPEGSPTSTVTQCILFWQNKTMQMMYEVIYKALVEVGLENVYEPQDYLMFFCLGNRESSHGVEPTSPEKGSNAANTPQSLTRKNRRVMIGVHSKGMIVDDEYVILGSANINQRSLEGNRDTEIAMGACQPYHTWANKGSSPHGQVFGYRMSLWAEHIGGVESTFERPESIECVRRVRSLSESNWNQYAAVEVTDMKAHLLKYPIEVDCDGQVKPLPGCPNFPDMGGSIVGTFADIEKDLTI